MSKPSFEVELLRKLFFAYLRGYVDGSMFGMLRPLAPNEFDRTRFLVWLHETDPELRKHLPLDATSVLAQWLAEFSEQTKGAR